MKRAVWRTRVAQAREPDVGPRRCPRGIRFRSAKHATPVVIMSSVVGSGVDTVSSRPYVSMSANAASEGESLAASDLPAWAVKGRSNGFWRLQRKRG